MTVSFAADILPLFSQFQGQMMWRFDLTDYEHVKANHERIGSRISDAGAPMPPPPLPRLTDPQVQLFRTWVEQGCPP